MKRLKVDVEVVVDDRALASEVPERFARRRGVFAVTSRLACADYSIRGVIGIRFAVEEDPSRKASSRHTP